jgi:hypothetical protein
VGNLFPHWHKARHNPGGNTQQLINAWGMGLDDLRNRYSKFRKDLFIGTADLATPDVFYHGSVGDLRRVKKNRQKNLVSNPGFSVLGLARADMPIYWSKRGGTTTASVETISSPTFAGSYALQIQAEIGESAYICQRITTTIPKGIPITASIWYRNPLDVDTISPDIGVSRIGLAILYADGSMEIADAPLLLGTGGRYVRASCTLSAQKTVFSMTLFVHIANTTGQTLTTQLGAAQVELSDTPSRFEYSQTARIPYVRDSEIPEPPFDVYVETSEVSRRYMTYMPTFEDLWTEAIPSRAELTETDDIPTATQRTSLGWLSLTNTEDISTSWRVANNKIEVYNSAISHEIFGAFDIAEFWLDDWYNDLVGVMSSEEDPDFQREIETLCVFNNMLYVVCRETTASGTIRTLKIVNPRSLTVNPNAYEDDMEMRLECVGDVDLGISAGSADYLGTIDSDPATLLIRIDDTYYTISFEFDYYTYQERRGQVILRTNFGEAKLVTI